MFEMNMLSEERGVRSLVMGSEKDILQLPDGREVIPLYFQFAFSLNTFIKSSSAEYRSFAESTDSQPNV
jgi:hypothetical protein